MLCLDVFPRFPPPCLHFQDLRLESLILVKSEVNFYRHHWGGESPSSVGLLTQGVQQISVAGFAPWLYFVNAEVGLTLEM